MRWKFALRSLILLLVITLATLPVVDPMTPAMAQAACPAGQHPLLIAGTSTVCIADAYVSYTVKNSSGTLLEVNWIVNGQTTTSSSFSLGRSISNTLPASDGVIVQLLTYVSQGAGTASGSGYVSQTANGQSVTHGCYIQRESGWNSLTIDVTGTESNVTCSTAHTTSSNPLFAFTAPPTSSPGRVLTCPAGSQMNGRGACISLFDVNYVIDNKTTGDVLEVDWTVSGTVTKKLGLEPSSSSTATYPVGDDVSFVIKTQNAKASGPGTVCASLRRQSGWSGMTVSVTGTAQNITCSVTAHTTSTSGGYQ